MSIEDNYIVFSSGRRIYLPQGTVGLSATNTDERWLFDGSSFKLDLGGISPVAADELDPEEAMELADYMIALWHRFRTWSDQRVQRSTMHAHSRVHRPAA